MDAEGRKHTFVDKVWIFSEQTLDSEREYPTYGLLQCLVLSRWTESADEQLVRVRTAVEATDGTSEFMVFPDQVSSKGGSGVMICRRNAAGVAIPAV